MQSPGWQSTLWVTWCLTWWFASFKKSMVIHDTECPYWGVIKQHKLNQTKPLLAVNRLSTFMSSDVSLEILSCRNFCHESTYISVNIVFISARCYKFSKVQPSSKKTKHETNLELHAAVAITSLSQSIHLAFTFITCQKYLTRRKSE